MKICIQSLIKCYNSKLCKTNDFFYPNLEESIYHLRKLGGHALFFNFFIIEKSFRLPICRCLEPVGLTKNLAENPIISRVFAECRFFLGNILFVRTFAHHLSMKWNIFCAIFRIDPHHTQQVLRIFSQNSLVKNKIA